jgi:bilirubin oxidase
MLVNGTLRAQFTVPGQVVRFRILNGAIERSYNIGFSDNRNFAIIGSDGGLLNAPVSVNRYLLHAGERVEILVDFSGQTGQAFDLKAYNSTISNFTAGGENFPNGPFANYLGHKDFTMLHLKVGAQSANPITAIPATLKTNVLLQAANADLTRILTISDSTGVTNPPILGPNAFIINHKLFDLNYTQYQVPLGHTEIWEIRSTSVFGHPFHIHDVEFNILSINGAAPPPAQAGWKDVVFIPGHQTVRFIAKFDDYADALHPFMYHCHISLHEDEGMMGQFVVTQPATGTLEAIQQADDIRLFPNPASDRLFVTFSNPEMQAYYVRVVNSLGKTMYMLPKPQLTGGIDISRFPAGVYILQVTDEKTKQVFTKQFTKA